MDNKFIQSDLPTLMIKVLFDNCKWYDKTNLYKETKKYYESNPNYLNIIHFLFEWEVLLTNSNFISVMTRNDIQYIRCIFKPDKVTIENSELFMEPDSEIKFELDESETITHICENKKIYFQSNVLNSFLLKNFPQYRSVYELLIVNRNKILPQNIVIFINTNFNFLEMDPIIKLVLIKNNEKDRTRKNQIITKPNSFLHNLVWGIGFVGISSLVVLKNPWSFRYFKWF